ncbi:MAG: serine--tRNA ligase [Clostridiales bacterium]|jgi:seryl-tRNA synthetase|nr:serine--tRNA ligase [Clostridiales bacterium]
MLDIKRIAEDKDNIKVTLLNRNCDVDIDSVLVLYNKLKDALKKVETLKEKSNKFSADIAKFKKQGKDTKDIVKMVADDKSNIKILDQSIAELEKELKSALAYIPNIPDSSVPIGKDESGNVEVLVFGDKPKFDFSPKAHWDLGNDLKILDQTTAANITGSRFCIYRGLGARLERSLINFMLDTHTKNGYTEIFAPFMVNADSMFGTGQLPKFEEDMFKVASTDYYLVPTAEVTLTNMHSQQILNQLNLSYCAYSACFRKEGGSAGRDSRGLIRQHQFNKIELVKICTQESSQEQLEIITKDAQSILQLLELPYRIIELCTGDLGFSSAKTYDIEVWMPSYNRYVEISSCSNFGDFQSRRSNIKYRDSNGKTKFAHTLNGSGLAVGRTVAAILENYQQNDGTITVPKVLLPYMGTDKISL